LTRLFVAKSRSVTCFILGLNVIVVTTATAGVVEVDLLTRPEPVVESTAELFVQVNVDPVLCSMEVHLSAEGAVRAVLPRLCPSAMLVSATETLEGWRFLPPQVDGLATSTIWPVSLVYESGVVVTPVQKRNGFELIYVSPYLRPRWEMTESATSLAVLSPTCSTSFAIDGLGLPIDIEVADCSVDQVAITMRKARRWGFEVVGVADSSVRFRMELPAED
jgi:hypothetical protein